MAKKKKHPQPFFRRFDSWWYVQLGSEQIKLVKGEDQEDAAWKRYHAVMIERGRAIPVRKMLADPTVTTVCNLFLDWSKPTHASRTYQWYRDFLKDFCGYAGRLLVSELDTTHVAVWLDRHPDWKGTRRGATIAVKRAFNWAFNEKKIADNPLRTLKKPKAKARDRFLTQEERKQIYDNYPEKDPWRLFLRAMELTACRPGEIARVTSEQVKLREGIWQFEEHKTASRTGENRIVILVPEMRELTEKLLGKVPAGTPLFRNKKGKPWARNSIRCRFRRIREKLGLGGDVVAYLYRHAVTTDMLEAGVGIAQTAEMLGHKGTGQVMKTYQKLRERREHLRSEMERATKKISA